ncbi:MAG: ferrous iron transport protein B, partial [Limisphaerales bacterium]
PTIVVLNMLDVAKSQGVEIDSAKLADQLGCPVVDMIASRSQGVDKLSSALTSVIAASLDAPSAISEASSEAEIYAALDVIVDRVTQHVSKPRSFSQYIDQVVLNKYLAFPIFLGVMYLMFLLSINVGSAFIDFFDLFASAIFVEAPRFLLTEIQMWDWLVVFIADGIGGGIQLVATFIPVIGALFLVLSLLEDSGYMARVAFIVDRLLRSLGLPGKSFVPLIVGFGCNVPAVMATRALDSQPDRILTTLMAPYMSCGARLTVYALFAAAFFPENGQNIVFALYLIGIAVAVLSALAVRRHLLPESRSNFIVELPPYHAPILRNILLQTWQRLRGFIVRAGKAIVIVVIALNVVSSIGTDGSVGNENSDKSVLSAIGKSITPLFSPMGIEQDNWPATVGIFTGIFAKEVVVGTLDALYAPNQGQTDDSILEIMGQAFASVPANLSDLTDQLLDPLGLSLGDLEDTQAQAESQEVQLNTITAMQTLFVSDAAAFAYLLFILLYMPCVATIGVIFKEIGSFWAVFSVAWSFVVAYAAAVVAFQIGNIGDAPLASLATIGAALSIAGCLFFGLIYWGKQTQRYELIDLKILD